MPEAMCGTEVTFDGVDVSIFCATDQVEMGSILTRFSMITISLAALYIMH